MIDTLVNYSLFVGSGLYLVSALVFLYLFIRTLKTKDGIGLAFLKILTFNLFLGSFVIFTIRILSEYGDLDLLVARAIAVINPILLVTVGLYLNYVLRLKIGKRK